MKTHLMSAAPVIIGLLGLALLLDTAASVRGEPDPMCPNTEMNEDSGYHFCAGAWSHTIDVCAGWGNLLCENSGQEIVDAVLFYNDPNCRSSAYTHRCEEASIWCYSWVHCKWVMGECVKDDMDTPTNEYMTANLWSDCDTSGGGG